MRTGRDSIKVPAVFVYHEERMTAEPAVHRGRARWPWIVGLVTACILLALWQARLVLLEWGIETWAERTGYGPVAVEVVYADLSRLELRNLQVGATPGVTAARLVARYTVDDLQHGRMREVEVNGLRFSAAWNGYLLIVNGLGSFGPFTEPLDSEVDETPLQPRSAPPPLPLNRLRLTGLDANVTLPEGSVLTTGDLRIEREADGGIALSGVTEVTALMRGGTLRGSGSVTGGYSSDGRLHARIALADGSYSDADRSVAGLSGTIETAEDRFGARMASTALLYESGTLGDVSFASGSIEGAASLPADTQQPLHLDLRFDHAGIAGPSLEIGPGAVILTAEGSAFARMHVEAVLDSDRIAFEGDRIEAALLDLDLDLDRMLPQRAQARLIHRGFAVAGIVEDAGVLRGRLVRRAHATQARLDWGWGLVEAAIDAHEDSLDRPTAFRLDAKLDMRRLRRFWPESIEDVGTLRIGLDGRIERPLDLLDGRIALDLSPGSRIALDGARLSSGVALAGTTALFVGPDGGQLGFDMAKSTWGYRLNLTPLAASLQLPGGIGPLGLKLGSVTSAGASDAPIVLTLTDSAAALPDLGVDLASVSGEVRLEDGATTLSLEAGTIRQTGRAPLLAPLALRATARSSDNRAFAFEAALTRPDSPVSIRIDGRHDLSTGAGRASLDSGTIALEPGRLQPEDVFPGAAGLAERVEGKLAVQGTYRWTGARLDASHRVRFDDLNFDLGGSRLNALNGTVRIDGLTKPTTPPRQRLTAVMLTSRLDAAPMELVFQLRDASRMLVEKFAVGIAGGHLVATEVPIDLADAVAGSRQLAFGIDVDRIDLTEIFRLLGVDGLDGTGRISGRIPVRIDGPRVSVSQGRLQAEGPGRLGYSGTELAETLGARSDVVGMAMDALADFRYDALSMELQKQGAQGEIMLRMTGANPDTLAGHPFQFNIRFTSDFDRLADFVLMGTDVAGTLLRWATGREPAP